MLAVDLFRRWKKNNPQVENVVLFISDAFRWDYTPYSVLSQGVIFKTVASGIYTAISFPSIVTGLYPQHHGVYSFHHGLPKDIPSLLNLPGYNTSLWTENTWIGYDPPESSPIYSLIGQSNRVSLENIQPPFIYLEDEKGGHCPYGWSPENGRYEEWDCQSFFRDVGKRGKSANRVLKERYQKGVERSVEEFKSRMRMLDERGLTDSTLIVFLSDHGELLGEYGGLVGHGYFTAPEVVYVPTVFIHPDLPTGMSFEEEGVLRHVDLYPTICDLMNKKPATNADGVSLLNTEKLPHFGCTYHFGRIERRGGIKRLLRRDYELIEESVWDKNGGYLFREGANPILRLLWIVYVTALHDTNLCAIYQRERFRRMALSDSLRDYGRFLKYICLLRSVKYGSPSFDLEEAILHLKKISESKVPTRKPELERKHVERIKDKLEKLGYF